LNLAHARAQHRFCLEKSRILIDVKCRELRVDGELSLENCFFAEAVDLEGVDVRGSTFLRYTTFKGRLNLGSAKIGSNLEMGGSSFEGGVDLTMCTVTGDFLLGFSEFTSARWEDGASLTLRNTRVGALQDWWRDESANAWPKTYQLEGFTYDRLGSIGEEKEADMLGRPVSSYIQWLKGDPGSSPQPYEHLADRFHEVGEPHKAADILYAARERRRRRAWSTVDNHGKAKRREWPLALGLSALRVTIGYGLGNRYFHVLWWVAGLTVIGTLALVTPGDTADKTTFWMAACSFDQLIPLIELKKEYAIFVQGEKITGWREVYFYFHKIAGWMLGSFLVAGLAGLTQRN
jgi:hypothetical protein